jgi:hypothetical protein
MTEHTAMQRVLTRDTPAPRPPRMRPFLVAAMPDDSDFLVIAVDEKTVRAVVSHRRAIKQLPPGIPAIRPIDGGPR